MKIYFSILLFGFLLHFGGASTIAQYPQNNYIANQPSQNFMAKSTAFSQEIARMEINVVRDGKATLPIAQVPRLEKNDVIKLRLFEEPINGLRPDQSNYDWTFLVAFVNPGRNEDSAKTVSQEINFRKSGWYKEYAFVVPYDSQPIFFLYPKPQYRKKILNLITKNHEDIRKIGEKTIEIADAYGKIGMFLSELQSVVNRNYYQGGYYNNYNPYSNNGGGVHQGSYNSQYGGYYGSGAQGNQNFLAEQAIERIAKGFNIQLPSCWSGSTGASPYGNNAPGNYYPNNNPGYNNSYSRGMGSDLMGRIQCVAQSVRIEDFDISVAKMFQQGGILLASQFAQKYPQLAFWINVATVAVDFIVKLTNRVPLRIIPTVVSNNLSMVPTGGPGSRAVESTKISLFAESQPNDNGFVTAYPMVFHKWQPSADPSTIRLPMPVLADSCLHVGQNILRTTDVINDWMNDNFTKDFLLTLRGEQGDRKEFALKKNVGFGGWELMLTKENLDSVRTIGTELDAEIVGTRGFNTISSPKFKISLGSTQDWSVETNSANSFSSGGRRTLILRNQNGSCRCLEQVVYRQGNGRETIVDSKNLNYSPDGKTVSFEIDTKNIESNPGGLDLKLLGGETVGLRLMLFPIPPSISDVKLAKGDNTVVIYGEGLEQVQAIRISGTRAIGKSERDGGSNKVHSISPNNSQILRERSFVFENAGQWLRSGNFALELELDRERILRLPNVFSVTSARPTIVTKEASEVEGFIMNYQDAKLPDSLVSLPIFSMETSEVGVNIQNALTDFDFKTENLRIEARIENTPVNPVGPPEINFEVLDWRSIRLRINLNEQTKNLLGGRRLQFRIVDAYRGMSDWYTIKQTFVRLPQDLTVKCSGKECQLTGKGVAYIMQVSLDNGKTWFPESPTGLISKPVGNGYEMVIVPNVGGKRSMKIKLRDFPVNDGVLY